MFDLQLLILSTLLLGQILCNPVQPTDKVIIESSFFSKLPDGGYEFSYDLSDGSYRREFAQQREIDGVKVLSITGKFGFVGDDGEKYDVSYNAGEQGFVTEEEVLGPPKPRLISNPDTEMSLVGGK